MVGDRLWDKDLGQAVVLTQIDAIPKEAVFVGSIDVGSFVKYYLDGDQLFVVDELAKGRDDFLLIRKVTDPSVTLYVRPTAVTSYRIVDMEDVDQWFEYY
jgi:hypothetical protein